MAGKSSLADEDLWNDFIEGDKEAMSELFLRYYGDLYRYGFKIISNEEVVRDGIQDLFFRLWKKRGSLEQAISAKKYLLVSLRRILLRHLSQHDARRRRNQKYIDEMVQSNLGTDETIIRTEMIEEQRDSLDEALSELTERQREILFLKFYEGYSNNEIAEMINLSYQRVCNISHEAMLKLRKTILQPPGE